VCACVCVSQHWHFYQQCEFTKRYHDIMKVCERVRVCEIQLEGERESAIACVRVRVCVCEWLHLREIKIDCVWEMQRVCACYRVCVWLCICVWVCVLVWSCVCVGVRKCAFVIVCVRALLMHGYVMLLPTNFWDWEFVFFSSSRWVVLNIIYISVCRCAFVRMAFETSVCFYIYMQRAIFFDNEVY